MKIGIDISQVVYGTGVSIYTKNLVRALLKIDQKNEYVLFGGSLRQQQKIRDFVFSLDYDPRQVRYKIFPFPPLAADFVWNRLHLMPVERLIGPVDVFHSSDWTQPPTAAARVTTIHDLSFLRWPETVHPKVLAAQKRRLDWIKKEKVEIIAVSQATKQEISGPLGISENQVRVIYEGLDEDLVDLLPSLKKQNEGQKIKKRFGIHKDFIFAYGSASPRKNIPRLLSAFEKLDKKLGLQLVITGEYRPDGQVPSGVILSGFIPRPDVLELFAAAALFVYPSLYEGFGLPILEAFALGVPVVTSNRSSMPEVAGKAAVLVDPLSVQDIARGIQQVIKKRGELIQAGYERVKRFSWEKCARETLGIYERAVAVKRGV